MFALFLDKGPEILNFAGIRYVARNMNGLYFKCLMLNIVLKFALLLDNLDGKLECEFCDTHAKSLFAGSFVKETGECLCGIFICLFYQFLCLLIVVIPAVLYPTSLLHI